MKGIDVSWANGKIDWSKIKRAGVDFAIIRSSFGSDLPGQVDKQFKNNAEGCIKNGIPFGTYHFAYFVDKTTARAEAEFAVRMAKQYPQVRMIALDIEEASEEYAHSVGASPDWTACAEVFLDTVKKAGFVPVLYTNLNWMRNKFQYDRLKKYALWYAAPDISKPQFDCAIWQYSWKGHPDGTDGDTDMDYCYDDRLFKQTTGTSGTTTSTGRSDAAKPNGAAVSQEHSARKVQFTVRVAVPEGVNLRSGAGDNYRKLGSVPCNVTLQITHQTSGGSYTWGLTDYKGIKGWIALNFTQKVQDKSIDQLAHEVIQGQWGAGTERERLLHQAGYDYKAVQKRVNELME